MNIGERRSSSAALFVGAPDELAPFARQSRWQMGPKVTAVTGMCEKRCGKPAWIGALSRIDDTAGGGGNASVCDRDGRQRRMRRHAVYLSLLCAQIMPLAYSPGRSGRRARHGVRRRIAVGRIQMARLFAPDVLLYPFPVQMYQRQLQPVVIQLAAVRLINVTDGASLITGAGNGEYCRAQMQFKLTDTLAPFASSVRCYARAAPVH